MNWLVNMFGASDYLERDPFRKFVVGLAHAFGAAYLIEKGVPMGLVIAGYFVKEVVFDLARVFVGHPSKWLRSMWADRWLVSDSLIDWCFWWLGAAMVAYNDPGYGDAVLIVGAAYFVAGKWHDNRN